MPGSGHGSSPAEVLPLYPHDLECSRVVLGGGNAGIYGSSAGAFGRFALSGDEGGLESLRRWERFWKDMLTCICVFVCQTPRIFIIILNDLLEASITNPERGNIHTACSDHC
jgi:hypothetical protein